MFKLGGLCRHTRVPFTSVVVRPAASCKRGRSLQCCHAHSTRREALVCLTVAGAAGMSTSGAASAETLPLVPKEELAPGLQVSRVRLCCPFLPVCQSLPPDAVHGHAARQPDMLLPLQVIKGCWQLSGGHRCGAGASATDASLCCSHLNQYVCQRAQGREEE